MVKFDDLQEISVVSPNKISSLIILKYNKVV